jgi:hypothetical protein
LCGCHMLRRGSDLGLGDSLVDSVHHHSLPEIKLWCDAGGELKGLPVSVRAVRGQSETPRTGKPILAEATLYEAGDDASVT